MDVSIIIVNWNTKKLLLDCLASVYETVKNVSFEPQKRAHSPQLAAGLANKYKNSKLPYGRRFPAACGGELQIFLVDNASSDSSVEAVKQNYPDVKIIQNKKNLGFAAANNIALERMRGQYALLLNTDTILTSGAVEKLFDFMEKNPTAGMACGQLLNKDGSKQNSIANFPGIHSLFCNESLLQILFPKKFPGKRKEYRRPVEVDSCIGACLMVRKKAMDEVGLLDKRYFFFFEETDWAYRMKRSGWKIYFVPSAKIFHIQGQTVGHNAGSRIMFYRSRYVYFKKWHKNSYPLICFIIFIRLLINATLSLAGVVVTIGMHAGIRSKLSVYSRLILWHLAGCTEDR